MPSLNSNSKNDQFTLPNLNATIKKYILIRQRAVKNQTNRKCSTCKPDKCPKICTPLTTRINSINNNLAMLQKYKKKIKKADEETIKKIKSILTEIEKSTGEWEAAVIENRGKTKFKF